MRKYDPEKRRAYMIEYRSRPGVKERMKAWQKSPKRVAWKEANRDKIQQWCRDYDARHKDERIKKRLAWAKTESGRKWCNEYMRKWVRTPKGRAHKKEYFSKRRVRADGVALPDSKRAIEIIHSTKRLRCFYCSKPLTKSEVQVEHMRPLARGGIHAAYNIVPSCVACNKSKLAKPVNQFIKQGQLFLIF